MTLAPHVMARRLGDDCVMLDLRSGTYFGLGEVGARLWELLAEGRSVPEARATLGTEYDVTDERLAADLEALLGELAVAGLVIRD